MRKVAAAFAAGSMLLSSLVAARADVRGDACRDRREASECRAGRRKNRKPPREPRPARVERRATADYLGPAAGVEVEGRGAYVCAAGSPGVGCLKFTPEAGEAYVALEIVDRSGTPVAATVAQAGVEGATRLCGRTEQPIEIFSGVEVFVRLSAHDPACGGVATAGTVNAVFSNLP
ncbi:MAG: hypothetical protein ABR613_01455 [Actinomycetota bacterium]